METLTGHSEDKLIGPVADFVPVIDVSPYFAGDSKAKQKVADKIGRACREIGFYIVVGHGVSSQLVERVDRVARAFFDLPFGDKMKLHIGSEPSAVGYSAIGDKSLAYTRGEKSPPDLNKSFRPRRSTRISTTLTFKPQRP